MRRLLLLVALLLAPALVAQPRPPLTRALADSLYLKLTGGTVANLTVTGTCTGCGSGGGSFLTTDGATTGATTGPQILQNGATLGVSSSISGALKFFSAGSSRAMLITISTINGAIGTRNVTLDVSAITGNPSWIFPNGNVNFTPLLTPSGTGNVVLDNGPTLIAPLLGTPASGVMTNVTGTAAGLTAGAATVLATPRQINGVNFDGSAAITVPAAAGTLTGSTLAAGVSVPNAQVTGLAASATTDTTNAANISSGTLPAGRLPAFTGDITTPGGSVATTLANAGAGAGSCTNCSATVDAKGRVTAYSSGSGFTAPTGTGVVTVTSSALDAASTSFTSNATASTIASRDSSANMRANNYVDGYTTTATAAGTTTLTVASTKLQFFTGSTTQTVTLPVASTLVTGQEYYFENRSTGTVTVNSSGANLVLSMPTNTVARIWCILTSGTSAASWSATPLARTDVSQTVAGVWTFPIGSAAAPSIVGVGGTVTGLYWPSTLQLGLTTNGVARLLVDNNETRSSVNLSTAANVIVTNTGVIGFVSSSATQGSIDTGLSRDAAGDLDIGTGGQGSTAGRVRASAVTMNINATAKTANYTTVAADYTILANTSGGAFTVTLSSTNAKTGQIYNIKMTATSTNALTLSPSSGNIDGSASATITPTTLKEGAMVQFDGTNWWIVGTYSGVL